MSLLTEPRQMNEAHTTEARADIARMDAHINSAPPGFDPAREFPAGFWDFFLPLHDRYTPRQQALLARRARVLEQSQQGDLPTYLPPSTATTGDWHIEVPEWAQDQRNQMTGPSDDAELVVKMLNSGAPGVMIDLEDSMANFWPNLMTGYKNTLAALRGELSYFDKKRNVEAKIKDSKTVLMTRA